MAREVTRRLDELERQLAQLADAGHGSSTAEEASLLDSLTRLAREIEGTYASTTAAFRRRRRTSIWSSNALTSCASSASKACRQCASLSTAA